MYGSSGRAHDARSRPEDQHHTVAHGSKLLGRMAVAAGVVRSGAERCTVIGALREVDARGRPASPPGHLGEARTLRLWWSGPELSILRPRRGDRARIV
jgi:hypothetical protein